MKSSFRKKRKRLIQRLLETHGYNNYQSDEVSGEEYLIGTVLASIDPELCVDVGANVGKYSRKILSWTNARVIAFEPQPGLHKNLESLAKSFPERMQIVANGVGKESGTLTLRFNEAATEHASFVQSINEISYVDNFNTVDVSVVTLDHFFGARPDLQQVDLLKIDTEGFEEEVLQGARNTIARLRPKLIQFEYNQHQMLRGHSVYSLTRHAPDYILFQLLPNSLERRDPLDPLANVYMFSNFVLIRPDVLKNLPLSE